MVLHTFKVVLRNTNLCFVYIIFYSGVLYALMSHGLFKGLEDMISAVDKLFSDIHTYESLLV